MEEQHQLHTKQVKENVDRVKRRRFSTVYSTTMYTQGDNGPTTPNPVLSIFRRSKGGCI